ncbi:hypothetical protein [Dinoroseobacter sp. S124A]|uniref:hypothetical protein n=1 Tax=Dinoroseobacter sp. S124A TaxID=3415128 RepID=UPI003C7D57DE
MVSYTHERFVTRINDESVRLVVLSLARECHDFAISCGIASHSVEHQLELVLGIIDSHRSDLLDVRDVPALNTTDIAAIRIGFSDEGYLLLAEAAKDRLTNSLNVDADVF